MVSIKKTIKFFIAEFVLSSFLIFLIFKLLYENHYEMLSLFSIILILLVTFITSFIIYIIYRIFKENRGQYHKYFVALMIPVGLLYLIFLIPGHVPDEHYHYYRAYEISTYKFIPSTDDKFVPYHMVPEDLISINRKNIINYSQLKEFSLTETNYDNKTKVDCYTQAYVPILYIMPATSFVISRLLNLNIIYALYLARIFNFIAFLILGYYSVKLIPFGKILLTTYLFIPMVIHQGISISADSLVNSILILFISFILNLYFKRGEITKKEKTIFYLLSSFVAIAKTVYAPLIFISLILLCKKNVKNNENKFSLKKTFFNKNNTYIWIGCILCIIIALGWFLFLNNYRDANPKLYKEQSSLTQTINLIQNPVKIISILFNTIKINFSHYLETFIGLKLGWLDIVVDELFVYLYLFLLIISPFLEKHRVELTKKQKILFFTIFIICSLLIFISLFIVYNYQYSNYIRGIQGRYFIPIGILLLLSICYKNKYVEFKRIEYLYPILIVGLNIAFVCKVACYFFR